MTKMDLDPLRRHIMVEALTAKEEALRCAMEVYERHDLAYAYEEAKAKHVAVVEMIAELTKGN